MDNYTRKELLALGGKPPKIADFIIGADGPVVQPTEPSADWWKAVKKELMAHSEGAIHEFRQSLKNMDDEQVAALLKSEFSGVRNDARRELKSRGIGTS